MSDHIQGTNVRLNLITDQSKTKLGKKKDFRVFFLLFTASVTAAWATLSLWSILKQIRQRTCQLARISSKYLIVNPILHSKGAPRTRHSMMDMYKFTVYRLGTCLGHFWIGLKCPKIRRNQPENPKIAQSK